MLTRNISPAPSASLAVMIGVCTQKKPRSWKKRWIGHAEAVPDARDGAERVRARPQVRDLAQVLERVLLRLNRIGLRVVDPADDLDRVGLQLDGLPLSLARASACRWR